jgi:hypothetical protein
MFPSENKPVEYVASAWIGKENQRIWPTPQIRLLVASALVHFKYQFRNPMFNIFDVSCKFLDITLENFEYSMKPLAVKLLVMSEDISKLSDHYLLEGNLYLSGDAEIDESIPVSDYKDKHWILCSQITHICFTKLYWEAHDDKNKKRITLLDLGSQSFAQP